MLCLKHVPTALTLKYLSWKDTVVEFSGRYIDIFRTVPQNSLLALETKRAPAILHSLRCNLLKKKSEENRVPPCTAPPGYVSWTCRRNTKTHAEQQSAVLAAHSAARCWLHSSVSWSCFQQHGQAHLRPSSTSAPSRAHQSQESISWTRAAIRCTDNDDKWHQYQQNRAGMLFNPTACYQSHWCEACLPLKLPTLHFGFSQPQQCPLAQEDENSPATPECFATGGHN